MAYTELTVENPTHDGAALTENAADTVNGDKFTNTGSVFLMVYASSGAANVIIETGGSVKGIALADITVALTDTQRKLVGPFDRKAFNIADGGADDGSVRLTYSGAGAANVKVSPFS